MGGNSGLNSLFVQPEIKSYEQLRGTTMAVDAPNTAFALLLYKMLDVKGIKRSDYKVAAGRRDAPAPCGDAEGQDLFGGDALAAGIDPGGESRPEGSRIGGQRRRPLSVRRRMGAALLGQGPCRHAHPLHPGECRRHPLGAQSHQPRRADGRRRGAAEAAARGRRRNRCKIADDQKGFATDARFDIEGFRNVLKLRADMLGTWGGKPPAPDKYLDLSYYDRALKGL